jgi:hypothetical protein
MIRFAHPSGRLSVVQRASRFCPACAGMTVVLGLSKCHSKQTRLYRPSTYPQVTFLSGEIFQDEAILSGNGLGAYPLRQ